jgi:predicted RecB family nuclease
MKWEMKSDSKHIRLSASDLSNHLACNHLTSLDLSVAVGGNSAPSWRSPDLWVLQERGFAHEKAYLDFLADKGLTIVDLRDVDDDATAFAKTCAAMGSGVPVIVQATLESGRWLGRADVLQRVERPSKFGAWSYEVYDCKLARETKAETILQLSLYSELLETVQGIPPEYMYVVPPAETFQPEPHRVLDYAAYYRYVKTRLEKTVDRKSANSTYPEPTPHCSICRWWSECDAHRRKDDHLSLVAGIRKLQRKQLISWQVSTVEKLAKMPLPLGQRPEYGSPDAYVRVREQARVQVAGRNDRKPVHELLEIINEQGFSRLPQPSPGDIFFDLEGDPFVGLGGREYLFGYVTADTTGKPVYHDKWAVNAEEEKRVFEWFVDSVMAQWAEHPGMHIYHFTAYEPSALKRLMGRYATREDEIDRILRGKLLVDLHTVLRQAVRASVEEYSLKALEVFHGFERAISLDEARQAMRQFQHSLELGRAIDLDAAERTTIETYNADDCLSTKSLRDWFEREREALERAGQSISRPVASDGAPPPAIDERQQRIAKLVESLVAGIPADSSKRTEEQSARWLLAALLDWHRREDKADWWEYFRLRDLADDDLLDERDALAGLQFVKRVGLAGKLPVDRYEFEKQESNIRTYDNVCQRSEKIGEVVAFDLGKRWVDIKKTKKASDVHPSSIFVDKRGPKSDVLSGSLFRLGEWVKNNGLEAKGGYRAACDLLLRRPPRLTDGVGPLIHSGESTVDAAKRIGVSLDHSVLAIQGPPGAGKTYGGARMICELIQRGKKVGVTAMSHKVIRNLLEKVLEAAKESGIIGLACVHKVTDLSDDRGLPAGLTEITDNAKALAKLQDGYANVLGGTAWLWSREDFSQTVDVLFIDEAGQMSLANVLAMAQAAKSIVLIGDPQQLDQPQRGSHPEGAEASALEHLLAGARTIPEDKGLFLEKTWRLHPKICDFTSEVFYEGRLEPREGLSNQRIEGHPWLGGAGLWFAPVNHEGNQNSSPEEVERIGAIVDELLQPGVNWIDDKGRSRPFTMKDILIVAPYNAQVSDLLNRLQSAQVGTVDKFQGQEAPVVIYSLTTSSPEEAPRGMEFLYSLNRLNVATSRARAVVIVVGSPRLLEPECRSPRQMQLANALCRYAELAQIMTEPTT